MICNGLDPAPRVVDAGKIMLQIITSSKTSSERAAIAAARAAGITCHTLKPRRNDPGRRSYRQCLQQNATEADGSLIIGNIAPPFDATVRMILECNKPTTSVAAGVAMQLGGAASTRRWLRKHRIKRLNVTGTAPTKLAAKFLTALLKS